MNADKLKDFFIFHGEKLVLVIVTLASAWLIYGGLQVPSVLDNHQPDKLTADANTVRASIDEDHTEAILPTRKSDFDILQETLKRQRPVDPKPYSLPNLLERRSIDASLRREDPQLAAPQSLLTHGVVSSIAMLSSSGNYPAKSLEGAEALERIETKPVAPPPRPSRRRNMMSEDEMMMEEEAMNEEMMMEEMPSAYVTPAGRAFPAANDFGTRPVPRDGKQPVPVLSLFIAGTAVVPHKTVSESFKAALAEADGYSPLRDQPMYYDYQLQRADVTDKPVDQLAEADWVLVRDRERDLKVAATQWAGFAPELVPADYRDANITGYIPPVLLTDYSRFSLHPLIPMVSRQEQEAKEVQQAAQPTETVKAEDLELIAPGGAGGIDYSSGYDDMQMDMTGMVGMGGYAMTVVDDNPVEYKIMRFYDFASSDKNSIRLGRQYVYRLRYCVNDPNFPANPLQQPKVSSLSSDVYTRVQQLMADATKTKQRNYRRWSDWSEPSPPTTLPPLNDYFAGPVTPARARTIDVAGKAIPFARDLPKASVLNFALSIPYATRMPIWMKEITPGSTLSYQGAAEVIDPIALTVKKVPEAKVTSQTTVIDFQGGEPLQVVEDATMTEPSVMLIYDENGNLKVTGEVADQLMYRIYSFADERGL